METIYAVEFKGITKRFGSNIANDKVDLYLDKGIIMSLLGENGSGKTTLMNMLAGIYFPDEGQIFIDGKPVSIASPKDAFANGIGMIHQHFKLIDVFTAAENIVLGLRKRESSIAGRFPKRLKQSVKDMGLKSILIKRFMKCLSPKSRLSRFSRFCIAARTS